MTARQAEPRVGNKVLVHATTYVKDWLGHRIDLQLCSRLIACDIAKDLTGEVEHLFQRYDIEDWKKQQR